jgi:hypothetical protein
MGRFRLVEASENRTRCPGQDYRRSTTGVFGDLDLTRWTPTDRVPLRQPSDLLRALLGIRLAAF